MNKSWRNSWRTILLAAAALAAVFAQTAPLVITTPSPLPFAVVGEGYSTPLVATGGSTSRFWFHDSGGGPLPTGFSVDSGGAVLFSESVVAAPGLYTFNISVFSSEIRADKTFQLRIYSRIAVTPSTLPDATRLAPYTTSVAATGGAGAPYTWNLADSSLPQGLTLNPTTGAITGTPTGPAGVYAFLLTATDAALQVSPPQQFQITIHQVPLTIAPPTTLERGVINVPYTTTLGAQGGSGGTRLWSIQSGGTGLPNNLTLSSAGVISGTPVQSGTFTFRARVSDFPNFEPQSQSADYTLVINPLLAITTTNLPAGEAGTPYSGVQLAATGGQQPPLSWTVSSGALPPGLSLSSGGAITGTPTAGGTFNFIAQVTDAGVGQGRQIRSRTFSIVVEESRPIITTVSLPVAQAQTSYSQVITATGGTPPYSFAIVNGALPSGFVFTTSGQILGSSPGAASSSIVVRVTDQRGRTNERAFSFAVSEPDRSQLTLEVATESLPEGTVGKLYALILAARNGEPPYSWSIGGLPPGVEGSSSGEIIGTPTRAGTFPVQVAVSDAAGKRATRSFSLVIKPGSIIITTERVPDGRVGQPYSAGFAATGGVAPYRFGIVEGSAPSGVSFNAAGVLTGTPTAAGTFQFTVQATDSAGATGVRAFTAVILPAQLTITTSTLGAGTVNAPYSSGLAASGGRQPYRWSVSGLPTGLSADSSTGAISGTPTQVGSFAVSAQVTDADNQNASKGFTLEIAGPVTITTTSVGNFVLAAPASSSLAASGGRPPYAWSVTGGGLPAGVNLGSDGSIGGTPTALGPFSFTAQVRDQNNQTATRSFSGQVVTALVITTESAPAGQVGVPYSLGLTATGGTTPYRWSATGNLPPGLSVDASGLISGTPTASGSFSFNVSVSDSATPSQTAQRGLSIAIGLPQLSGLTIVLPTNPQPQQQPQITVSIDRAFPAEISGTLSLTFVPNATTNADDPFIQFSTGGRSVPFTIPAGQTQASFRVPEVGIQTGTTAGTITLTTALTSGGSPLECNCQLVRTIVIPRGAPVITSARLQRTPTGFTLVVTGFSTGREVTQGTFRFAGTNLQTTESTVPLTAPFNTWFQSTPSQQFGGQFTLTLPFTIQGDSAAVTSMTVILTNAAGSSQPATATF